MLPAIDPVHQEPLQRKQAVLLYLVAGLVLLAGLLHALVSLPVIFGSIPFDMHIFVERARHFWQTGELYVRAESIYPTYLPGTAVFKFPPVYQLYIAPWVTEGVPPDFYPAVYWLFMCCYLATVVISLHHARSIVQRLGLVVPVWLLIMLLGLALCYEPFYRALCLQAAEIPLALLLCCAIWLGVRQRLLSGFLVAMAGTAKLYPFFIGVWFICSEGRWRFVAGLATGSLLLCLVSLWLFGWQEWRFYIVALLPQLLREGPTGITENISLVFWLLPVGVTHAAAAQTLLVLRVVLLLSLLVLLLRCRRYEGLAVRSLLYGQCLIVMVLCLANYWQQYLVVLLPPLLVACVLAQAGRYRAVLVLLLMAILLMCQGEFLQHSVLMAVGAGMLVNPDPVLLQNVNPELLQRAIFTARVMETLQSWQPVGPWLLWAGNSWLLWSLPWGSRLRRAVEYVLET